jgi:anaerobic ribonucleoside-triphosphate reductase
MNDNERTRCECWTRVMGYMRPVSQFNIGKQAEHKERKPFVVPTPTPDATPA